MPWDERCKNAENLVLKTKEEPKVSDIESNLVGSIVISEPRKIEIEGMRNVSNNNDALLNLTFFIKEKRR